MSSGTSTSSTSSTSSVSAISAPSAVYEVLYDLLPLPKPQRNNFAAIELAARAEFMPLFEPTSLSSFLRNISPQWPDNANTESDIKKRQLLNREWALQLAAVTDHLRVGTIRLRRALSYCVLRPQKRDVQTQRFVDMPNKWQSVDWPAGVGINNPMPADLLARIGANDEFEQQYRERVNFEATQMPGDVDNKMIYMPPAAKVLRQIQIPLDGFDYAVQMVLLKSSEAIHGLVDPKTGKWLDDTQPVKAYFMRSFCVLHLLSATKKEYVSVNDPHYLINVAIGYRILVLIEKTADYLVGQPNYTIHYRVIPGEDSQPPYGVQAHFMPAVCPYILPEYDQLLKDQLVVRIVAGKTPQEELEVPRLFVGIRNVAKLLPAICGWPRVPQPAIAPPRFKYGALSYFWEWLNTCRPLFNHTEQKAFLYFAYLRSYALRFGRAKPDYAYEYTKKYQQSRPYYLLAQLLSPSDYFRSTSTVGGSGPIAAMDNMSMNLVRVVEELMPDNICTKPMAQITNSDFKNPIFNREFYRNMNRNARVMLMAQMPGDEDGQYANMYHLWFSTIINNAGQYIGDANINRALTAIVINTKFMYEAAIDTSVTPTRPPTPAVITPPPTVITPPPTVITPPPATIPLVATVPTPVVPAPVPVPVPVTVLPPTPAVPVRKEKHPKRTAAMLRLGFDPIMDMAETIDRRIPTLVPIYNVLRTFMRQKVRREKDVTGQWHELLAEYDAKLAAAMSSNATTSDIEAFRTFVMEQAYDSGLWIRGTKGENARLAPKGGMRLSAKRRKLQEDAPAVQPLTLSTPPGTGIAGGVAPELLSLMPSTTSSSSSSVVGPPIPGELPSTGVNIVDTGEDILESQSTSVQSPFPSPIAVPEPGEQIGQTDYDDWLSLAPLQRQTTATVLPPLSSSSSSSSTQQQQQPLQQQEQQQQQQEQDITLATTEEGSPVNLDILDVTKETELFN